MLLRPISEVTTERQRRLDDAETLWTTKNEVYRQSLKDLERRMEEAARRASRHRTEARQSALDQRQKRLDGAHAAAQERLNAALAELGQEADAASRELKGRARELAGLLASHLLEREIAV